MFHSIIVVDRVNWQPEDINLLTTHYESLLEQHINDPRFRGVYLLLATLLPYNEALLLREKLLQNAAETKDHVVSDQFIQRLNSRSELSMNGNNLIEHLLEILKMNAQKSNNTNIEFNPNMNMRNEQMNDFDKPKYDMSGASIHNLVDQEKDGNIGNVVEKAEGGNQVVGTQHNYTMAPKKSKPSPKQLRKFKNY